jgi:hypothetical protein
MDDELLSPTRLKQIYAFVLVVGIGFYFVWSFTYNAFFDYATFTISIILVLSGLVGTFLYREIEREKAEKLAAK